MKLVQLNKSNFGKAAQPSFVHEVEIVGEKDGELQAVFKTKQRQYLPIAKFVLPDTPYLIVNWNGGLSQTDAKGEPVIDPSLPIRYQGKLWRGDWAWGSAIKGGKKSIAIPANKPVLDGLAGTQQGRYRLGRALFDGAATCGFTGDFNIAAVEPGTAFVKVGSLVLTVDDGAGFIRQSVAEQMKPRNKKITYANKWKVGSTFWQWVTYGAEDRAEAFKEVFEMQKPTITKAINALGSDSWWMEHLEMHENVNLDEQSALVKLEQQMEFHPYVMDTVSKARRDFAVRTAMGGNLPMHGGVVIPGYVEGETDKIVVLPMRFGDSMIQIVLRYPIDGPGSIRLVKSHLGEKERTFVDSLETVQYTLTQGLHRHWKGMLTIIPDDLWPNQFGDAQIVNCTEDKKLDSSWTCPADIAESKKTPRKYQFKAADKAVFTVHSWMDKGASLVATPQVAKDLNADFDGDTFAFVDGVKYAPLTRLIAQLPQVRNPKLPKRHDFIVNAGDTGKRQMVESSQNIVGFATNIYAQFLATAHLDELCAKMGVDRDEFEYKLRFAIKYGTDGFKSGWDDTAPFVSPAAITKWLNDTQVKLNKMGVRAPYVSWLKAKSPCFRSDVPRVGDIRNNADGWSEWQQKNYIHPDASGVVPMFLQYTLPQMDLPPALKVTPLSHYRQWAIPPQSKAVDEAANTFVEKYNDKLGSVNLGSRKEYDAFMLWAQALADYFVNKGITRDELANAVWYKTHSSDTGHLFKKATAVFWVFPDEAKDIIKHKPGLAYVDTDKVIEVKLRGGNHQFDKVPDKATFEADIRLFYQTRKDRHTGEEVKLVRLAVCPIEPLEGQRKPKDPSYPKDAAWIIDVNESVVEPGRYNVEMEAVDKYVQNARLSKVVA